MAQRYMGYMGYKSYKGYMGYMKITPRGLKFRNIMDWHLPRI
jgi:hypothetical protein